MRVSKIQIAVGFKVDPDLMLVLGPALKAFATAMPGSIQQVGLPSGDCPPDMPQIIIQGQGSMVNLAMERLDIFWVPPRHINGDYEACSRLAENFSLETAKQLLEQRVDYRWCGVVSQIKFPTAKPLTGGTEAAIGVYERLLQVPRKGRPLAAFDLHFGYLEGSIYKTYGVTGYATRNIPAAVTEESQGIEVEKLPVTETGIQVHVDVNNKPEGEKRGIVPDLETVFNASRDAVSNLGNELNLSEVLR